MIDTTPIRRALEQAARDLTALEFSLRNLVLAQDAPQGALEAHQRGVAFDQATRPPPASPAGRQPSATVAKVCEGCGAGYHCGARGAHKSKFCPPCADVRRRESNRRSAARRKVKRDRAAVAEIIEQNAREGYSNLSWRNGRAAN